MSAPTGEPRTRSCAACGALNGADFDRCIRCGGPLTSIAKSVHGLARPLDGTALHATKAIIALSIVVFGLQMAAFPGPPRDKLDALFLGGPGHIAGPIALRFGAVFFSGPLAEIEPLRLISAVFVHYGALHLVLNMFSLGNFARIAEPAVGSARFLLAYVATGAVGFATTAVITSLGGEPSATAGASGAVFGIMGLVLGLLLRLRDPRWKSFAVQAVLFSVLFGFAVNASRSNIRINNSAHLGGLAAGVVFGLVYAGNALRRPRGPRSDLVVNIAAAAAVLASIASLIVAPLSPLGRAARQKLEQSAEGAQIAPDPDAARPRPRPRRR